MPGIEVAVSYGEKYAVCLHVFHGCEMAWLVITDQDLMLFYGLGAKDLSLITIILTAFLFSVTSVERDTIKYLNMIEPTAGASATGLLKRRYG